MIRNAFFFFKKIFLFGSTRGRRAMGDEQVDVMAAAKKGKKLGHIIKSLWLNRFFFLVFIAPFSLLFGRVVWNRVFARSSLPVFIFIPYNDRLMFSRCAAIEMFLSPFYLMKYLFLFLMTDFILVLFQAVAISRKKEGGGTRRRGGGGIFI